MRMRRGLTDVQLVHKREQHNGAAAYTIPVPMGDGWAVGHGPTSRLPLRFPPSPLQIWLCSQDESNHRVHEFFKSHHFAAGIETIPGAQRRRVAWRQLSVPAAEHPPQLLPALLLHAMP